MTMLCLGLTNQGVHHVFPSLHWAHSPALWRILEEASGVRVAPKNYR
eukprot:gene5563-5135_t